MKLSANGWSHLCLCVTNIARAKRFYVDILGCPLVRETERAVFVTVAGLLIALLGADAHTPGEERYGFSRFLNSVRALASPCASREQTRFGPPSAQASLP
jgi:catechol 2,3-dioxygenase-like lactoylglutathione lyase family enzyme